MKKVIPAILLLFFFVKVLVSQTTNGRIQIVKDPSGSYICNIQVNVDNGTLLLGNFVNRIHFNPRAISFPSKPLEGVDYSFNEFQDAKYFTSVTRPNNGTISLNVAHMSGNGLQVGEEYTHIAKIRFKTISTAQDDELGFVVRQFFEPYSTSMWDVGTWSVSSLSKEYIPVPLLPIPNSVLTITDVTFKWQDIGADYYKLEISLDESFRQLLYSVSDISKNEVIVQGLSEGTKYYWRVQSVFGKEQSHFSKGVGFTVAIKEPSDLNSSSPDNDQYIELNWQNNSVSAQYIVIDRKESGSQHYTSIDTINANRTSYIDPSIESEQSYVYRVSAINENTTSTFSDSTSIIMSLKKSEVENDLPKDFQLMQNYPNPFNPQTTINYSVKESSNITITIYSLLGEKITSLVDKTQNAGNYDIIWNATNYPSGIYIYVMSAESNISSNTFQNVKKMIVLK